MHLHRCPLHEEFRKALSVLTEIGINAPVTYDADDYPGGYEYNKDVMTVTSSARIFVANAEMKRALEREINEGGLTFSGKIQVVGNQ